MKTNKLIDKIKKFRNNHNHKEIVIETPYGEILRFNLNDSFIFKGIHGEIVFDLNESDILMNKENIKEN